MYEFKIIEPGSIPWDKIEECDDHILYKSQAWVEHLAHCYHVSPYVLEVYEGELIGYFVGERFRKVVTIVAAGFEGWSTPFQGLSMLRPVSVNKRIEIYTELIEFLFRARQCSYFQATDWHLELPHVVHAGLRYEIVAGYVLDLTPALDEIVCKMSSSAKTPLRKARHSGITFHIADDMEEFIATHYEHLRDVFGRQHLKPTKSKEEVREQILSMHKWKKSLLLEARSREGESVASMVYLHDHKTAFALSGGSLTRSLRLSPNEPLMVEGIRILKERGITTLELGGGRRYKEKYGPVPYVRPRITACRFRALFLLKKTAKEGYYGMRTTLALFRRVFPKKMPQLH